MNPPSFIGIAMVLAAAALWGTTGTAQSLAPAGLPAHWVGALRLAIAAAFFAVFVLWLQRRRGEPVRVRGLPWPWLLLAGACMAAYNLTFFAGIRASGVAVGTAIAIGSGPVWAGLLQLLASRRPPRAAWWAGTVLAVAGGVLMVLQGGRQLQATPAGVGLCLAAGLSYAAYALINKRLVGEFAPSLVTLVVFTCAAALAVPVALAWSGGFSTTPAGWAVVAYLGVVTTGVAYLLFSSALRHISGATGVTLALGEPVTAFALAILVVNEQPGPAAFAGLALVLVGLAVVVRVEIRPTPEAAPPPPKGTAGPPQGSLTPAGGGLGEARTRGRVPGGGPSGPAEPAPRGHLD
jgi:DME family drug/metabolite transporter